MIVGLSVSLGYIIFDNWREQNQKQNTEIFNEGYEKGLIDATTAIFVEIQDCHPAVLAMGNFSKTIFDFSCLETETP